MEQTDTNEIVAFLQRVADHFEDTDAPLGIEARRLLANFEVLQNDDTLGAGL